VQAPLFNYVSRIPGYCSFLVPMTTIMRQLLFENYFVTLFLDGGGAVVVLFMNRFESLVAKAYVRHVDCWSWGASAVSREKADSYIYIHTLILRGIILFVSYLIYNRHLNTVVLYLQLQIDSEIRTAPRREMFTTPSSACSMQSSLPLSGVP
jgi:hypothetical protein